MKKTKILAGILAVSMMFAGCGKTDDEKKDSSSEATTTTTEAETTETTTEAEEETTEADADAEDGEPEEEEPASEEELQAVKDLIAAYETAVKAKDYETMVDLTDADLLYYISYGKEGTKEELVSLLDGTADAEEGAIVAETDYSNTVFGEPHCYNSQAKIYNEFLSNEDLAMLAEEGEGATDVASKYTIDGLYTFSMSSDASASADTSAEEDADVDASINVNSSFDMDMFVVRINGEWKIDTGYVMIASLYTSLSGMDESDFEDDEFELDVEADEAEEVDTTTTVAAE